MDNYEDRILVALRDSIDDLVKDNGQAARELINKYLNNGHSILKRLGLYILARYPSHYIDLLIEELLSSSNIVNTDIHHEYFMLLQVGYPRISLSEQNKLLENIFAGLPQDKLEKRANLFHKDHNLDRNSYITMTN